MGTFREEINRRAKQAFCQIISNLDNAAELIDRAVSGDEYADASYPSFLNLYLCNRDAFPPVVKGPFTGGQCPCVAYRIHIQGYTASCNPNVDDPEPYNPANYYFDVWGPVKGVSYPAEVVGVTACGYPAIDYSVEIECQGPVFTSCGSVTKYKGILATAAKFNGSVVSVTRLDGQPDTCGDPKHRHKKPPPGFNKSPGNITYVNNDGNNITVPVGIALGYAKVDVDAKVNMPISIDIGEINVNANIDLNTGDINFGPKGGGLGDRRPGENPIDYLPPPDKDVPDEPPGLPEPAPPLGEGEGEKEGAIVGAVVTVTSVVRSEVSTFFQGENPDISIPNFGYIAFYCRVGKVSAAWTSDLPVKNRRMLIPCPWNGGAFKVAGTPRKGVTWEITPIYSKKRIGVEFPTEV